MLARITGMLQFMLWGAVGSSSLQFLERYCCRGEEAYCAIRGGLLTYGGIPSRRPRMQGYIQVDRTYMLMSFVYLGRMVLSIPV